MTKILTVALLSLAIPLAGCASTKTTANTGAASATVTTKVDDVIAKTEPVLARYCAVAIGVVAVGQTLASKPAVQNAINIASITINTYCSAPPTNTEQAIAALAEAGVRINAAIKATREI